MLTRRLLVVLLVALSSLPLALSVSFAKETDEDRPLGSLGGAVHADPFTGVATTSIPIDVPPGPNGMQPNLSLIYNSSSGNGWVGMGWELEQEGIFRQTKWGVNYTNNTNGTAFTVTLAGVSNDLVPSPAPAPSTQWNATIESGFSRIEQLTASDGQIMWKVTTKQGRKHYFGETAASRQVDPANAANIFGWLLDRLEDPDGNYLTLTYWTDTTNNQIYLSHIDYAGNTVTGALPTNTVKFWLDDGSRPDQAAMYTTNYKIITKYRLKTIDVQANGLHVRAYALTYTPSASAAHSLLASAQQFGKDATVNPQNGTITSGQTPPLPAAMLGYGFTGAESQFKPYTSSVLASSGFNSAWTWRLADVNGDGRADSVGGALGAGTTGWYMVVALANPDGTFQPYKGTTLASSGFNSYWSWNLADVNGDGRVDAVGGASTSSWGMVVALANNDGTFQPYVGTQLAGSGFNSYWSWQLADVNGDGKADVVNGASTTGWWMAVALSNGDGTFKPYVVTTLAGSGFNSYWSWQLADVNGDGNVDVVNGASTTGWWMAVAFSNGDGTFKPYVVTTLATSGFNSSWVWSLTDVNGDGKVDAAATALGINTSGWYVAVALSNGNGTFQPYIGTAFATTIFNDSWRGTFADINGDGRADAVGGALGLTTTGWYMTVALSNGDGTFQPYVGTTLASSGFNSSWGWNLADVNGDGKVDAVGGAITSSWVMATAPADGGTMMLTGLSNGLGGATAITYAPSTQWPNTQLPFPVQHVSALTTCDNWNSSTSTCSGTSSTTTYNYSGGYYHIGQRELRGVNYVSVTSPASPNGAQTLTEIWFHQGNDVAVGVNDPSGTAGATKGLPYHTKVSKVGSPNMPLTETTTSYLADADGVAPWFTPLAVVTTSIYDSTGAVVKQTQTEAVSYDAYGNLTLAYNRGDFTNNNAVTSDDKTVAVTYGNYDTTNWFVAFPTVESTYAGLGTTGTLVAQTKYSYDGASSCTTPAGNLTPTKGHVTKVERSLQGGTNPLSGMEYNSSGSLTCTRDPLGNTTRVAYDPTSTVPLTRTNALGQVSTLSYYGVNGVAMDTGLYGQVKSVTDANNQTATNTYDALGRKLTTTAPDGLVSTTAYNYGGTFGVGTQNLQRTTSGGGLSASLVSKTYFDGLGRTIKKENPGAADGGGALKVLETDTQYDARGLVTQTSLPFIQGTESVTGRWRTLTYDALGRMIQMTNPDGTSSQVCYNGWTTTTIDPKLHKKVEMKDAAGRLSTVQDYTGTMTNCATDATTLYATTTYQYDVLGNLLSVTDPKGNVSTMTYDTLSRKLTMHDPDMGTWIYSYDANGNLLTQVDAKSQKLCFSYDALNRRTQKNFGTTTQACGTNTVAYSYDDAVAAHNGKGRVQQVTDPAQSVSFQYDSRGRITQSAKLLDGTTYTTTSVYDGLGRLTTVNYPTSPITTVTYTYDGPQLKQVTEGATTYVTYAGWNGLGQAATATFGNGVVTTSTYANTNNSTCTQQTFRLCTLQTQKGTTPRTQDLRYDYEANGNVWNLYDNTVASNAGDQHLSYDELDRLTLANGPYGASGANTSFTYQYDAIGNLTLNSQLSANPYTYPASGASSVGPHAVTTAGANTYTYDTNGNMLTGAGRTYTWNSENKPLTIVQGGTTTTFVYDGDGGRVKKIVGSTTTRFISKLYECDNTNCSRFIWAGNTRIATVAVSNGTVNYWHGDHLSSSSIITDSSGAQVETVTYYPYGGTRTNQSPSNPAIDVPYKYTGQELDASTGLYYYEARDYDPALARLISADTLVPNPRDAQSLNRYSYVGNSPFTYTDPTGHLKINFKKFVSRAFGNVGTAVLGTALQFIGPFGMTTNFLVGGAIMAQSQTGRYVLAGEIVVGTAAVAGVCIVASAGTCGAAAPAIIYGAAIGASSGAALGGYSAAENGGDLSSGILFGAGVGATTGALTGWVSGFEPLNAPLFSTFGSNPWGYLAQAGISLGSNMAAGTVLNAGAGAIAAYAGGRGQIGRILSSAGDNALSGLPQESGLDVLGGLYEGLGNLSGGINILTVSISGIPVASAALQVPEEVKNAITVIKAINNSFVQPDMFNYGHFSKDNGPR